MLIIQCCIKFAQKCPRKNVKIRSFFNFACVVCAAFLSERYEIVWVHEKQYWLCEELFGVMIRPL